MSAVFTLRMDDELKEKLEWLSKATKRSKSFLATEAIERYVAAESWQVAEILEGLRQACEGKMIPHEDIEKEFTAWEDELEVKPVRMRKRAS